MTLGDTTGYYFYDSDDGTTYIVKLTSKAATAGGFSPAPAPIGATEPVWGYGAKNLRHVTGKAGVKRARCPIASVTNALYQSGGTFQLLSGTYTIVGAEGERRPGSNVA